MTSPAKKEGGKTSYWSAEVTQKSDALDLEPGVFSERDPKRIARSLKALAEHSKRRKAGAHQSAMSMLNLFINRAGRNLPAERKRILEGAKVELRRVFGRE
jgi:acyl-CoA synthetase (NDP forming)